ncbi:unnamed protein product [Timema podura]|uniref:Uncharacterized protein n=1 Tax=Timema podura TaxID=61482 RepID=A0ABN7NWV9_TIMPD|nr:unnamed protein product [Timema podura]
MKMRFVILFMFLFAVRAYASPLANDAATEKFDATMEKFNTTTEKMHSKLEEALETKPISVSSVEQITEKIDPTTKGEEPPLTSNKQEATQELPKGSIRQSRNMDNDINTLSTREAALIQKLNTKCSQSDVTSCMMLKLITYMNRLLKKANLEVIEGIEITQTSDVVEETSDGSDLQRSGDAVGSDEDQLTQLVTDKVWNFVKTRSLKWNIFPETDLVLSTSREDTGTINVGMSVRAAKAIEMGRRKMKNMGGIIMAVALKIGMIGALAFKALVLLVGKAILVSKIALLLAVILWLKKLFSQERHVTYEVVAHPHHSHSHSHAHSSDHGGIEAHSAVSGVSGGDSYSPGWSRSLGLTPVKSGDPQELAYSAHAPQTLKL